MKFNFKTAKNGTLYFTEFPYIIFINKKKETDDKTSYTFSCKNVNNNTMIVGTNLYSTPNKAAFAAIKKISSVYRAIINQS